MELWPLIFIECPLFSIQNSVPLLPYEIKEPVHKGI